MLCPGPWLIVHLPRRIPLGYIFESNIVEILLQLFPQPAFRNSALQCLSEVALAAPPLMSVKHFQGPVGVLALCGVPGLVMWPLVACSVSLRQITMQSGLS